MNQLQHQRIRGGVNREVVYMSSNCQLTYISIFCAQLISEAIYQVESNDSELRLSRSRVSGPVTSVSDVVLSDTESSDTATNSTELVRNDNYTGHLLDLFQQLM